MGTLTKGSVVLIPFPFSDLSKSKLRPAIILAPYIKDDWIICQVTSKKYSDRKAIKLLDKDFKSGSLQRISYARAGKLFTANHSIIESEVGKLNARTLNLIIESLIFLLRKSLVSDRINY